MKTRRPLLVTLVSWLFIIAGSVGFIYHSKEVIDSGELSIESLLVLFVRLAAIIGGMFTLKGENWSRWLLIMWLAYHVVLSWFHSWSELAMHAALLVIIALILFHPKFSFFFQPQAMKPKKQN